MRPEENDYAPYYKQYVDLIEGEDILLVLDKQLYSCIEFFKGIPEEKQNFSYAPGKWTIKELISHLNDVERIYGYRALRVSRNDKTPLAGYDQDLYVKDEYIKNRSYEELLSEWELLRKANTALFKSFSEEMLTRRGTANNYEITTLAILFALTGHLEHHLRVIKDRYLL